MGQQLWTSPITGYRRRGTRLSELRSLIDSGITIHAILEPLLSCPAAAPAREMARLLAQRDFDVAGVQTYENGPVIGYVKKKDLTAGKVEDHLKEMSANVLISDATSLPAALSALKERPLVFVLLGTAVRGIATRADLNKPPVRIYLFSIVSLLEMHLAFWVRAGYPDDTWKTHLSSTRLSAAEKIQSLRKAQDRPLI